MKRNFLRLVLFVFSIISASGQNPVPNADFENWVDDNNPQSWYGLTIPIPFFPIYTVSKTLDSQQGDFAILVETKELILFGAIPGIASLAPVSINLLAGGITFSNGGFPVSVRPTKLSGYFKYEGVNDDTAMIAGVFTRWNTTTQKRDTLGMSGIMIQNSVNSYTPFQFNINLSQTPDSMNIILVSSAGISPQIGSALWVDNLTMQYTSTAGIEAIMLTEEFAYPNPASDKILFSLPEKGSCQVWAHDVSGRQVLSYSSDANTFYLDVRTFNPGFYVITVSQNGQNYIHKAFISR
jgi:hypothetical protein